MVNKKKGICIISFSDLRNDPRVRRQIFFLKHEYDIISLGLRKSGIEGITEFVITDSRTFFGKMNSRLTFLFARLFKYLYKSYIKKKYPIKDVLDLLRNCHFSLIVANGLDSLIIAPSIAERDKAKILLDSHEYEPKRIEDQWFHKLFVNPYKDFLCKEYLPFVDAMTTVSPGIAEEFHRVYNVKPALVRNIPKYKEVILKGVDPDKIDLIYHGLAHSNEKLERIIELMPLLKKKIKLTLLLVGKNKYLKYLKHLAKKTCPQRIVFKDPVKLEEVVTTIAKYDIGLVIIEPTSFKLKYALPNKLFESIMASLCVVAGPSPEIKKVLEEFNCGFVANSFKIKDIAKLINSLETKDITKKKKASLKAANFLNAEKEMKKFKTIVKDLIGD